ncbi:hypothetical protein INR77_11585 [Erythrobacter sp. SCSIO 43205]|uniref:beta strand repeat-containing protein n=1 Tax=Erythrobacter sp. SCSIO 43205 TaxID=2779361 RepID=UPI001CA7D3A5|nr:hypothetical protein [Erythrobacter sp. SCSIO 43205]UAB77437.1 hypothetical protein INR77_11585 [Erythrobacter sp. SCSIO 43205]
MSIIPDIPKPQIAPNRSGEIDIFASQFFGPDEIIYGVGDFIRLYSSDNRIISEIRVDGTVWAASTSHVSSAFSGFNVQNYVINGSVVAEADVANAEHGQANAYAVSNSALGQSVTNNGTIYAFTTGGLAQAISHYGPDVRIINTGLIAAETGDGTEAAASQALGIFMANGGFLHNQAGGQILAEGTNATAIIISGNLDPQFPLDAPSIINDSTIQAVSLNGELSVGILAANLFTRPLVIQNNGLIDADVAIRTGSLTLPATPSDVVVRNSASGIIRGDIEGDLGGETVINAGLIEGNLLLGEGNDIVDNRDGELVGWVALDWGSDLFEGGAGAEFVDGGRMSDLLFGGGGNDLLLGGMGADTLDGGSDNDGLYGDYGDDILVLAGADFASGGQGDDVFELSDLAFALIDGGDGVDTARISGPGVTLDLAAFMTSARVSSIEVIDLGTSGSAAILAQDANASLDGLLIKGGQGSSLALAGTWSEAGPTFVQGESYTIWQAGDVAVLVADAIEVQSVSEMPVDTRGLDAIASGEAAPTLADEPSFALADPLWLDASYGVTESITIGEYETWRSDGSGAVMSAFARDASVTNSGVLETLAGGRAVSVDILTAFVNEGTIQAIDPRANGYSAAFAANQTVPFFNSGTVYAEAGGFAEAAFIYARAQDGERIFENTGTIAAVSSNGEATGAHLILTGGDNLNAGEILATGATRATAVFISEDGHFINTGTIEAIQTEGDFSRNSAGLFVTSVSWRSSITNSGLIKGEVAIRADNSFPDYFGTLEITNEAGGRIEGDIIFSQTDSPYSDTDDTIVNWGTIIGDVSLGGGNDVFDSGAGSFVGDIDAGSGADRIYAGAGNHGIDGGSNIDTAVFGGNRADYTITQTAFGVFEVVGADGTDTLTAVEFAQFDDETLRLRPGEGVAVNFESADPSTYQDAMQAILDFDGNALGGDGAWLRIGEADVNGDGDIDQILVNDAIGRFATVGTAPDGLVYFNDNGWAGETRVAGIYIDPLVQMGMVEQGSPFDSQQRFQNDLLIENINRVLGADDYDGDGLQEVYFALTDGTAYLRAIMEFDGNIRYANYQDEQGVIDYLTANGFGEETYGTWFGGAGSNGESAMAAMPVAAMAPMDLFQAEVFG